MKIAFIADHCCIRVQKEALPLLNSGHSVYLISAKAPVFHDLFTGMLRYNNTDQLYKSIELLKDVDIFHIHNEPSFYPAAIRDIVPDAKIVFDMHDSMALRYPDGDIRQIKGSERFNLNLSNAVVYVSDGMRDKVEGLYKTGLPSIVLPSYVPKVLYSVEPWKWKGGIVYEGGLSIGGNLPEDNEFFTYNDYIECAKEFHKEGLPFHVYGIPNDETRQEIQEIYGQTAIIRQPQEYSKLIKVLGRYEWGLLGNIDYHEAWQYAQPNKLYDYLAGGLPVIAMNARAPGEFLEKTGMGISVKTVSEIKDRWGEWKQCRQNVAKQRMKYAMDNHIHKLLTLYENISG